MPDTKVKILSPWGKLRDRSGASRLIIVILLVLVFVMTIVISIPTVQYFIRRSEELGCGTALDTARRQLATAYMSSGGFKSVDEAKEVVTYVMDGWEDLCPGGGNIYIVDQPGDEMPYGLVCGMHDKDAKRRTRLNASWVLDQLREALRQSKLAGNPAPESIPLTLNGENLEVLLTDKKTDWKRGTSSTHGVEGTVVRYGISGIGDFEPTYYAVPAGDICYLSFADEHYCANWSSRGSWSGDSYGK